MQLNLSAQTDKPDLFIDYIEAKLKTGENIAITWDKSYIERTGNGFLAEFIAVNYYDEALNEHMYLHAEDIEGIEIEDFGLYTDISGSIFFKVNEMVFEEDNIEYILDPLVYSNSNHYLEQNSSVYFIKGKPYRIDKSFDNGIERKSKDGETQLCEGFYCRLYTPEDLNYKNVIDDFCLAVGYELIDLSEEAFEVGVKNYLDNKSIQICVYKDALNYNDEMDNLTYISVPRLWLYQTMAEEGITDNKQWFDEYTADNTEYIARKALADGVIIECSDKNINIKQQMKFSLDDKLIDAAGRQSESKILNSVERENEL